MSPDVEPKNPDIDRVKAQLSELADQFPDAFQKNIWIFGADGESHPQSALYISQNGEDHILLRPDGRLLRYTVSMGNIPVQWEHYMPNTDRLEADDDYLRYGQRAISILKARSQIGS